MGFFSGREKRDVTEGKLEKMGSESRSLVDDGKLKSASNVRSRMAVIRRSRGDVEGAIRDETSASALAAGYNDIKQYLAEKEGWNKSIESYYASLLAAEEIQNTGYASRVVSIILIFLGVIMVGARMTGNVIGNSPLAESHFVGIIIFFLGILGLFLSLRK